MQKNTVSPQARNYVLIAAILASGMAFLEGSVTAVAVPTIQSVFKANITQIQWVVNSYMLALSSFLLLSGSLGDRYGRKKIFVIGILLFTLASLLDALSRSINQLIVWRLIQGLGAAMMVPGSLAIINVTFPQEIRGKAIGDWAGYSGGVSSLGPFIGGWLVQTLGWPAIFYLNVPFGLLALFMTLKYVPESKNDKATQLDILGTIFITLSLIGIAYGLITGSSKGWTDPFIEGSFVLGIASFISFLFVEKKVKEPLVPFDIFKSPLVIGANITTFLVYFGLSGLFFFLALNFQQIQGYSPIQAGIAVLPSILIITFLSGQGGKLADRIGPRIPMIVGSLLVSFGMILLLFPGYGVNYFVSFLPSLAIFALGMCFLIAPLTKSALSVPHEFSGAASGANNAVARIAGLLAVVILGAIIVSFFTPQLQQKLGSSSLSQAQKQQILTQSDRLGGIEIPKNFPQNQQTEAKSVVKDAFLYGFRRSIALVAILAFLGAVVSFIFIYNPKRAKEIS